MGLSSNVGKRTNASKQADLLGCGAAWSIPALAAA